MAEITRLTGCADWIALNFIDRQRTPERTMNLGVRLQLAGMSLSNTVELLDALDIQRSSSVEILGELHFHRIIRRDEALPEVADSPVY